MFIFLIFLFVHCSKSFLNHQAQAWPLKLNQESIESNDEYNVKFIIWRQGLIPYFIDEFSFDKVLRDRIRAYLEAVTRLSALRFMELPRPPDDDGARWVLFINRRGLLPCQDHTSDNFTNSGVQRIVLGYDCMGGGGLASAVLALAGVPPQHNAPDRDKYIEIINENILPEKMHLFKVIPPNSWPYPDYPYDFTSAGHYTAFQHTKNGHATIKPKSKNSTALFEEKTRLSHNDILKINNLYKNARIKTKVDVTIKMCREIYLNNFTKHTNKLPYGNTNKLTSMFKYVDRYVDAENPFSMNRNKKLLQLLSDVATSDY